MLYSDAFKNPTDGTGYTVCDANGKPLQRVVFRRYASINEAEMLGILAAARLAQLGQEVITDSRCVITWLRKRSAFRRPKYQPSIDEILSLVDQKRLVIRWQPRDHNKAGKFNEKYVDN
jgi:ribonuclease HI